MSQSRKRIAFVLEEFVPSSPAQQLVDRFLMGYPRNGAWHPPADGPCVVHLSVPGANAALVQRVQDFGLVLEPNLERAVSMAGGVVVMGTGTSLSPSVALVERTIAASAARSPLFIYGALAQTLRAAQALAAKADEKGIILLAGTPLGVTWRLPEVDLPLHSTLSEALIVVQGPMLSASHQALEGLLPVLARRRGGEAGVRSVTWLGDDALWQAGRRGEWSWSLLAAALSRSNTPQGNSVKDGRTQDLVGLGQVIPLAKAPRGWLLEHRDGLRTALLLLEGVVADINFAVRTAAGQDISAQLYRPPPPADHQFSRLAETLENFLQTGLRPWSLNRSLLIAGLLEVFADPARARNPTVATPGLALPDPPRAP